jgi:plastocyanin
MHRTAIRTGLVAAAAAAALVVPLGPPAVAGGGCHGGSTEGEGDTVAMAKACFTPSILRVDPGTEVRFVNKDPIVHNVGGTGWGMFEDMLEGDSFTATFDRPGIYPFACSYHPGMNGAVVVGDGTGVGSGEQVTQSSATGSAEARSPSAATNRGSAAGWIGGGIAGLVLGAGLGLGWRRRPTGTPGS